MATSTAAPKTGVTHARPKSRDQKDAGKKDQKVVYPSDFGSHAGMANEEVTGKIVAAKQDAADPWVVLKDDRGDYATRKSRLDSGLADPNRFADLPAREKLLKELTAA
jgi:hypothetical protein